LVIFSPVESVYRLVIPASSPTTRSVDESSEIVSSTRIEM